MSPTTVPEPSTTDNYQYHLQKVLEKLKSEPTTITTDDNHLEARRSHEHHNAVDSRAARLVSAIEAFAAAHDDIVEQDGGARALEQTGHASLPTLIQDLHSAVDKNPDDVTGEVLKLAQSLVSKMQKSVGTANAPQPELEDELQQECARIVPKIEQGIVSRAEADHLHSLEARAHGHTEKGGLTAMAQSVAAKRERALSLTGGICDINACSHGLHLTAEQQPCLDMETTSKTAQIANNTEATHPVTEEISDPQSFKHAVEVKLVSGKEGCVKIDAAQASSAEEQAHGLFGKCSVATQTHPAADRHEN